MTVRMDIILHEGLDQLDVEFNSWWDNLFAFYESCEDRSWKNVVKDLETEWNARVVFAGQSQVRALEFDRDEDAVLFLLRWA